MGAFVFKDAYIRYTTSASTGAHNNLSSYVRSVALAVESETQDDSAMGDDWRSFLGGVKSWALDIECNQDFASGGPGTTDFFQTLGSTSIWWSVSPTTAAAGSTNPEFRGYAMLVDVDPVSGSFGDVAVTRLGLKGVGTLTRGTSSNTG